MATSNAFNRRLIRQRKEYLYRKNLEGKEKIEYEQKRLVKAALVEGKPLPKDLRSNYFEIERQIQCDDGITSELREYFDDEYSNCGEIPPKLFLTTSRNPSSTLSQFVKELKLVFPNCTRVNRGNTNIEDVISSCRKHDISDLILVHEHRGVPDTLIISHMPFGPTAYFHLYDVVSRHDISKDLESKKELGGMSVALPHLIFNNFNSKIGKRVLRILKYIFPVPKVDSQRIITFSNDGDNISFRHHHFDKKEKEIELKEYGPRFEMNLFSIKRGTVNQLEAEVEFSLRPYQNTAKRRKIL